MKEVIGTFNKLFIFQLSFSAATETMEFNYLGRETIHDGRGVEGVRAKK